MFQYLFPPFAFPRKTEAEAHLLLLKPGRNEQSIDRLNERAEPLLAKLVLAFRSAFSIHVPACSLAWSEKLHSMLRSAQLGLCFASNPN